jgi:hypothetical protein
VCYVQCFVLASKLNRLLISQVSSDIFCNKIVISICCTRVIRIDRVLMID